MGVYDNLTITQSDREERAQTLADYLNSLDGITAEVYTDEEWTIESWGNPMGALFSIDGTNIQGFYGYYRDINYVGVWLKNGDTWLIPRTTYEPYGETNNLVVHNYIDEKCTLICIKDISYYRGGLEVMLLNIGSTNLIGYKTYGNTSSSFLDISDLTFEDMADEIRVPYTYTNMFPYATAAGQLDFLNQGYFVNSNNIKKFTTEFLKECSTVNLLSSASLPAPLGNYLAIGAHCLAPLDVEGGN